MHAQSTKLATQLSKASIKKLWNVYSEFEWPASLPDDIWYMSPELISLHGTSFYETLGEAQQKKLSFWELCNFFSLVLQGERPLVQGVAHLLYSKSTQKEVGDYLHHFLDEENKHMTMFGMFCNRYAGKVYPEKKLKLPRQYVKGEEEVAFFCKVLVVEELGDYFNCVLMRDKRIHPLVQKINKVHHVDEARHLAFGRQYLRELAERWLPKWSDETKASFRGWLASYLRSSWGDYYNPTMYKDAGLENGYELRQLAFSSGLELRRTASSKAVEFFVAAGLLAEVPEL